MSAWVLCECHQIRVPQSQSLKAKRAALRPLLDSIRSRFRVSVAETDFQDLWQRAEFTVAVAASSQHQALEQMDEVTRFIWSRADIEPLGSLRVWADFDE